MDEEQLKQVAAQLRKPEGEAGIYTVCPIYYYFIRHNYNNDVDWSLCSLTPKCACGCFTA